MTKETIQKAFETAHDACSLESNGCIHADALVYIMPQLRVAAANNYALSGADAFLTLAVMAFHVGYRAAQLERSEPAPAKPKKSNMKVMSKGVRA